MSRWLSDLILPPFLSHPPTLTLSCSTPILPSSIPSQQSVHLYTSFKISATWVAFIFSPNNFSCAAPCFLINAVSRKDSAAMENAFSAPRVCNTGAALTQKLCLHLSGSTRPLNQTKGKVTGHGFHSNLNVEKRLQLKLSLACSWRVEYQCDASREGEITNLHRKS